MWTHYQAAITAGRQKFPLIDSLLSRVQDETMPCRVTGDVEWGLNRTASGWPFWCFNNKGVKKFSLEEERLDPAATAHVEVAFKPEFGGARLSFDVPPGGIVYRTVAPEPVDDVGELRFDAGRLLMERFPFKRLTVEDNLKGLREGMVPGYAVANVVKWLELMGVDMTEYRRSHKVVEAVAKPLKDGFRVGYMLDISRDKVPKLDTLKTIVDVLAVAGFSEFQLYTEHTFAYSAHAEVWKDWSPVTAADIRELDDYAWKKGVRLIPNQNSFGHLAPWFRHARYRDTIAEAPDGFTIDRPRLVNRPPRALCPTDPRSVDFLAGLYDELLPNFRHADEVNVGCDEVWDIFYKKGRSAAVAAEIGVPGLYMRHLLNVYDLLKQRGKRMAFWADMVLRDPELLDSVPRDVNALQWGYGSERSCRGYTCEFQGRCIALQRRGIPFTVCPQTFTCGCNGQFFDLPSSFGNIDLAVDCAAKYGAEGLLLTEWGDGGHGNPFLASLAQIVYTGLVCRGLPADPASVAAKIDQIAGAKIGEHLMAIWSTRREKGDEPDYAAIRKSLDAARATAASAPGWVRNGLAVVDLHLRVHDARQSGAQVPAALRDEYRRLWLEANRPGGLEASIAELSL